MKVLKYYMTNSSPINCKCSYKTNNKEDEGYTYLIIDKDKSVKVLDKSIIKCEIHETFILKRVIANFFYYIKEKIENFKNRKVTYESFLKAKGQL